MLGRADLGRVTGRVVVVAGTVGAVGQLASGFAPSIAVFVALMVGVAAAAVVLDTAVSTRVMATAPDALRGRVLAVAAAAGSGAGALGGPALGSVAEALGGRAPLLVGGAACLVAIAVAHRRVTGEGPVATGAEVLEAAPAPVVIDWDAPTEQIPALAL